jgi:integrase/recombinase XerD
LLDQLVAQLLRRPAALPGMKGAAVRGTPHALRHSFATQFIRDGDSVYTLKHILGHSDIKTTERYVHAASIDDMAAPLDKMDSV